MEPRIQKLKTVRFVYGAWYEGKQFTIKNRFRQAGSVCHNGPTTEHMSNVLVETVDMTHLWEHLSESTENTGGALWGDYLGTDNAAASFHRSHRRSNRLRAVAQRQGTPSDDNDGGSDDESGDNSGPSPISTRDALQSIQSPVGFANSRGLPPAGGDAHCNREATAAVQASRDLGLFKTCLRQCATQS